MSASVRINNEEEDRNLPVLNPPALSDGEEDLFGDSEEPKKQREDVAAVKLDPVSIPRKANATAIALAMGTDADTTGDTVTPRTSGAASAYGLPDGVFIPSSIESDLLQGKLLAALHQLPVPLINDALTEYDDAMTQKPEKIRNAGAYLFGVIKRYAAVAERGDGLSMGPELTPLIHTKLEQLLADGFCTEEEMNEKVKSKIRMLSEKDAIFAIHELAGVNRSQIRNFGSYFMGILNRYMRGDTKPKEPKQQEDRSRRRSDSNSQSNIHIDHRGNDHNRRPDDRYRGRSPDKIANNRGHHDDRGRSRYGNNDSYRQDRDRSRDRNDDRFRKNNNNNNTNPPPQISHQQYDSRRTPHFASGVPPPPPGRPVYGQQLPHAPYQQQQQHHQQQQHRHIQPQYGMPQAAVPPYHPQPAHSSFVPGQQQQQPVYMIQPGQEQQPLPHILTNQPQPPPQVMMGHQEPLLHHPPNMQPTWQPSHQQQQQQQQQQSSAQPDILGIADKAAQALAAAMGHLASHTQPLPQQQMQPQPPPQQQMQHGMPQHGMVHPQHQHGVPPYQPQPYMQHQPQPVLSMTMSGMPGMMEHHQQQPHQQQPPNHFNNSYSEPKKRRHTVAHLHELTTSVQHAVRNLHANGAIEGQLDEGILGMIKDLPEPLALQALQKFTNMDRSNMRNKTAYLAGLLRTELAKINLR